MKNKTENWIKEFDEKFVRDDGLMDKYGFHDNGEEDFLANVIKKFISQLLKSQKQDLIKKVETMKIKDENTTVHTDFGKTDAYNRALEDVIKLLKE